MFGLVSLLLSAQLALSLPLSIRNTRNTHYTPRAENSTSSTVAVAWYEGWNDDFSADKVSWSKYTHMTYSFAITDNKGGIDLSGSGDITGLQAFVSAAHQNNVKALVSVGGWTGSQYWSSNVASAENRTAFVKVLSDFAKAQQLDGLDFDWEYPVGGGMSCNVNDPADTTNFLSFLKELRTSVGSDMLLTAAAGVAPFKDANGDPSSDVSGFASVLDWIAIMNYDEYGQWSQTAGPNAALDDSCAPAAAQQGSAVSAVKAWMDAGIPANRLVLGVASYGRAFNVATSDAFESGSAPATTTASSASTTAAGATDYPASTSGAGTTTMAASSSSAAAAPAGTASSIAVIENVSYSKRHDGDDDGTLALFPKYSKWVYAAGETPATECGAQAPKDVQYTFTELVTAGYLTANGTVADGYTSRFDTCSQTPFLYDESKQMLVSYDDAQSFAAKGKFIVDQGLRGWSMWEASGDYEDILVDAIRAAVGGTTSTPTTPSSGTATATSASASSTETNGSTDHDC